MFKIGEFSKLTQVTIRMLRYYDETGLLKPAHTDPWTGYRMYRADQIPVLNRIIYLRDSGFQVSEIAEIIAEGADADASLIEKLNKKSHEIKANIQSEQEKLKKIAFAKKKIMEGSDDLHYHITIKSIPRYQVLSLRRIIPDYYAEGDLWKEISTFASKHQVQMTGDSFSIYHDTEYKETGVDVELCVPVLKPGTSSGDFIFRQTEPVPHMASTLVYGDFKNIAGVYISFAKWLQENSGYHMFGLTRQTVHRGFWNESNPDNYLTEIQIPLKKI